MTLTIEILDHAVIERTCVRKQNGKPMHLWRIPARHKDGDVAIFAYRFGTDTALRRLKIGAFYNVTIEGAEGVQSLWVLRGTPKPIEECVG